MPPRYAYWTILVDDQPTAFRAGSQEDLMPTFKRLQTKHASAKMMWFQNGKLWDSRLDAQEAMRARGEMGRRGDDRQRVGFRDRERSSRPRDLKTSKPDGKLDWKPKDQKSAAEGQGPRRSAKREGGLDWKPKGEFVPAPKRADRPARSEWTARPRAASRKPSERKPEWKPKGSFDGGRKPEWRAKPQAASRKPSEGKLEWSPRPSTSAKAPADRQASSLKPPEKRKWVPKEEYKRSKGIEAKRDHKWRPGGEHKDPKQKYKDAKKAKWTRFKQTIRTRWEAKGKKRAK